MEACIFDFDNPYVAFNHDILQLILWAPQIPASALAPAPARPRPNRRGKASNGGVKHYELFQLLTRSIAKHWLN
jgi:hypothetical protein